MLNKEVPTFAIELSSDLSFYRYIAKGDVINLNNFAKSGDPADVLKDAGMDAETITTRIKKYFKVK